MHSAPRRPIFNDLPSLRLPLATKEMLYSKIDAAYRHVVQLPSTLQVVKGCMIACPEARKLVSRRVAGLQGAWVWTGK